MAKDKRVACAITAVHPHDDDCEKWNDSRSRMLYVAYANRTCVEHMLTTRKFTDWASMQCEG